MCGIFGALLNERTDALFKSFDKIKHRGPDKSTFMVLNEPFNVQIGFHRLAINDLSSKGDQPFKYEYANRTVYVMCNGEIYNHKELQEKYALETESNSDCEVILQMYKKFGEPSVKMMCDEFNSEHVFVILDINTVTGDYDLFISSDRFGIRPLFIASDENGFYFSSELKGLPISPNAETERFKPRHYAVVRKTNGKIEKLQYTEYCNLDNILVVNEDTEEIMYEKIRNSLIDATKIRLQSDRPIGCLLSGGLDSSLVSAIASKELKKQNKQLLTFSVGMPGGTDEKYAKMVAEFIDSKHTHIELSEKDFLDAIPDVIKSIESYDITTIRASCGQYLIAKWISQNTDVKVVLLGDGSDEQNGAYRYFHSAPNPNEFHKECVRLMNDIHLYDGLRADRGVCRWGLEARFPFLDYNVCKTIFSKNAKLRTPRDGIEKYLLRKSFEGLWLPQEVLWRKKEAFSDGISAINKSWYQVIQEDVELNHTEEVNEGKKHVYQHLHPVDDESLYYRVKFCEYYGNNESVQKVIPYYWLPKWCEKTSNPSARVLSIY